MSKQKDFERLFRIAGETLHMGGYQTLQSELAISYKAMMDEFVSVSKEIESKIDNQENKK